MKSGGGAGLGQITLDQAYQGGPTINVTEAKGAVILSSARTSGNIFQITSLAVTLTAALTGAVIDLSAINGGLSNAITGLSIALPASTSVSARALSVASAQTKGTLASITGTGTLAAAQTLLSLDGSGITPGANPITGLNIAIPASTAADAAGVGGIVITSLANQARSIDCVVSNAACVTGAWVLRWASVTPLGDMVAFALNGAGLSAGAFQWIGADITVPAFSGATTAGVRISSIQTGGSGLVVALTAAGASGVSVSMGASCTLAALTIAHAKNNVNQAAFTAATDGAAFHLVGPGTGDFRLGAGVSAGAGRAVSLTGSAAAAASAAAGGGVFLAEGAGDGAGARGTISLGQNVNAKLQFFATGGAVQQTVTGSRGANAALASLLTKLASYGLIVDGSS